VAVVTGTRAEFGLLRPVMDAMAAHRGLRLRVIAAGSHLLPPAKTIREVRAAYAVAATVPMQQARGPRTRHADALATARGIDGFARAFAKIKPDWVVVLGDRIEAFAAASAASIAGLAVCHIHGGDRAEGIADEAMRHAISKLAHLHCAATEQSANRLVAMGERGEHVRVVGSPAIDGLRGLTPLSPRELARFGGRGPARGTPRAVLLMHPSGAEDEDRLYVRAALLGLRAARVAPVLVLAPNADAGSRGVRTELERACRADEGLIWAEHVPRAWLLGWMRSGQRGAWPFMVGNSSAGLIEAAALRCRAINLGQRQAGRERAGNVVDVSIPDAILVARAIADAADARERPPAGQPFGDGRAGERIARLLASIDPHDAGLLRKRNAY
jgi:UDP-hydrolysing UDP-N-acetyl-D-glucosamine 2-epimerase